MLRWNRFSRATKPNRSAINFTQPTSKRPERFQTTSIGFTTRLDCIHRLITRARSTSNRAVRSNQPSKHPERQDASFTFPLRSVHCQLFVGNSMFEVMPNSDEIFFIPTPSQWIGFLTGAGSSEHMWCDDALLDEVVDDHNYSQIK